MMQVMFFIRLPLGYWNCVDALCHAPNGLCHSFYPRHLLPRKSKLSPPRSFSFIFRKRFRPPGKGQACVNREGREPLRPSDATAVTCGNRNGALFARAESPRGRSKDRRFHSERVRIPLAMRMGPPGSAKIPSSTYSLGGRTDAPILPPVPGVKEVCIRPGAALRLPPAAFFRRFAASSGNSDSNGKLVV